MTRGTRAIGLSEEGGVGDGSNPQMASGPPRRSPASLQHGEGAEQLWVWLPKRWYSLSREPRARHRPTRLLG